MNDDQTMVDFTQEVKDTHEAIDSRGKVTCVATDDEGTRLDPKVLEVSSDKDANLMKSIEDQSEVSENPTTLSGRIQTACDSDISPKVRISCLRTLIARCECNHRREIDERSVVYRMALEDEWAEYSVECRICGNATGWHRQLMNALIEWNEAEYVDKDPCIVNTLHELKK